MKNMAILAGCMLLVSINSNANNLPDEINYSPYYNDYTSLKSDRDNTEVSLEESRDSLLVILDTIDANNNDLASLNRAIGAYEREIQQLQREIPSIENEKRNKRITLRDVKQRLSDSVQRESNLLSKIENHRRQLRPIKKDLSEKQRLITDVKKRLDATKRELKQKESLLLAQKTTIKTKKSQVIKSKDTVVKLKESKKILEAKKVTLSEKLKEIASNIKTSEQHLVSLRNKHKTLKEKLTKEMAKLKQLVTTNADPKLIEQQKQIVTKMKQRVATVAQKVKNQNTKVSALKKQKTKVKNELSSTDVKIAKIPVQISKEKQKQVSLTKQIDSLKASNKQLVTVIASLKQKRQKLATNKSNLEVRIAELSTQKNLLKEKINSFEVKLTTVSQKIAKLKKSRKDLKHRIAQLNARLDYISNQVPNLRREISYSESEIMQVRAEVRELKKQENINRREINDLEVALDQLIESTRIALSEYERRQNLYDSYKESAKDLGRSQTDLAYTLGKQEGLSLSDSISTSVSSMVGTTVGKAKAKLIGFVRGEIAGYENGYSEGYADSTSISRATEAGKLDGKASAINYAKTHFAPAFFEEFIKEELSKPLAFIKKNRFKSFKKYISLTEKSGSFFKIEDLSQDEIEKSESLRTSMDKMILNSFDEVTNSNDLYEQMKLASNSYETPSTIPFGSVDCKSVYKNLVHFKEICKKAYESTFTDIYLDESYITFEQSYEEKYISKFLLKEEVTRESNYNGFFSQSENVSFGEAKAIGKKDIYDHTYSRNYKNTYNSELPIAKEEERRLANTDVSNWIAQHPVITVEKSSFSTKNLRGADKGVIKINLKNISSKIATDAAILSVVDSSNLELEKGKYVFSNMNGREIKTFEIPFIVNPMAGSADRIVFNAKVALPGDKYKSSRIEQINISEQLAVNPKQSSKTIFNKTPKIKSVFKYYVHVFQVDISPLVESLDDGYEVSLKAIGSNAKKINMKVSSVKTKALRQNEVSAVKLKYSFPKSAKKKKIDLELMVKYKGEILRKETFSVTPR